MVAMRTALIAAIAAVSLAAPAASAAGTTTRTASAAGTTTQTASAGNVTATLSWLGQPPQVTDMRLSIAQSGTVVYNQPVTGLVCGNLCGPGAIGGDSVGVRDLDANGQLEVVLELYSEGAHCCFIDQVFSPSAALGGYVLTQHDFVNSGAALRDLNHNGQSEFVTRDNAFAYEFTDFAESGMPLQILTFSGLAFDNVTRQYPALIRSDARLWWRAYLSDNDSGRVGLIAAWAADEYNLGRGHAAAATLAKQVAEHQISARFVKRLHVFLKRHGYIR